MESEFELLGVEARRGMPAFALVGEPGTRKYVGSAFVSVNREMRERLCERVQEHAGEGTEGHEEAAGNAVGETGHESLREAFARRGRSSARLAYRATVDTERIKSDKPRCASGMRLHIRHVRP
ncbi:hypothetical protein [Mesorhizobium onobrychidis]|uniref:Uncharacterized protein n=1 Tax=Mesorhizobium onobrychidis TaxID=2775404 RepID=A0ABY5QS45_9HYPH|nr:hypothetical protein [Mesorhizobium onobrychidis]UVC14000.1 hypothetical protein IHQ72_25420 [Mesorhizobium onobrychidis]